MLIKGDPSGDIVSRLGLTGARREMARGLVQATLRGNIDVETLKQYLLSRRFDRRAISVILYRVDIFLGRGKKVAPLSRIHKELVTVGNTIGNLRVTAYHHQRSMRTHEKMAKKVGQVNAVRDYKQAQAELGSARISLQEAFEHFFNAAELVQEI